MRSIRPHRQGPRQGPQIAILRPAGIIGCLSRNTAEQGLIHDLKDLGIADGGDEQGSRALDSKELAGRTIGKDEPPPRQIISLLRRNDHHRIWQAFENFRKRGLRLLGPRLDQAIDTGLIKAPLAIAAQG